MSALPEPVALQFWSHDKITPEIRAQIEAILAAPDGFYLSKDRRAWIGNDWEEIEPKGENNDNRGTSGGLDNNERDSTHGDSAPSGDRVREKTEPVNPNIKQTTQGIWVLVNDSHISRWVEEHGTLAHDMQTLPFVLPGIRPGDTVIDGGAFIGDSTASFIERVGPTGQVIAFEPNPDARECLRLNCPTALVYAAALGNSAEDWMKMERSPNAGANFLVTSADGKENIPICRLDSLELERCDFVKLDIEGMEVEALKGAEQTINRFHPKLLVEVNRGALQRQGVDYSDLSKWLCDHGYSWEIVQKDDANFDSAQFDILCKWAGKPLKADYIGDPWQSPLESINEVRSLASRLKKFCTGGAHTRKVREELHEAGIIQVPYRFRKRKGKWRRRKAKA